MFVPPAQHGVTAVWLVGGSVRDFLLQVPPKDWDFVVQTPTYDHLKHWVQTLGGTVLVEKPEFHTLKAKLIDPVHQINYLCDLTLCRQDGPYGDRRRPDYTTIGTLEEDLKRRDFTVNAMALGPDGHLYDPHGGQIDLEHKVLRCVRSDAMKCFEEDPLRLLRAVRFKVTLGFSFHPSLEPCLQDPALAALLRQHVSMDRKREELKKCFQHHTSETLLTLAHYPHLMRACFDQSSLWLDPTLKARK